MEQTQDLGANRTIHLVIGPPGAGKSWVCLNLPGVCHVDTDKIRKKDLHSSIVSATNQELPIVMDITFKVSTTMKRYGDLAFKLYLIDEERDTIANRILGRGGKVTATLDARIKRLSRLKPRCEFFGTSSQVKEFLSNAIVATVRS